MSDVFRQIFKYYKAKKEPPDLSLPIDLYNDNLTPVSSRIIPINNLDDIEWYNLGLKTPNEWEAYNIKFNDGLIYIKNPFLNVGQRHWIIKCLKDYPKHPHKTNLSRSEFLDICNWWKLCNDVEYVKAKSLKKSLRWVTLGYHHNWDTKEYSEENHHLFPSDLSKMCEMLISSIGFNNYIPQAAIINYYHMDSTLAPHTDHSEKNLDAPLISISFGQSAIFLIGGITKEIEPTAFYLHSGDIIIMTQKSRLCYHAVPRIVDSKTYSWKRKNEIINFEGIDNLHNSECFDDEFWKPFDDYLSHSRININVRQVLYSNQKSLNDANCYKE